jgi:hypothetical protein
MEVSVGGLIGERRGDGLQVLVEVEVGFLLALQELAPTGSSRKQGVFFLSSCRDLEEKCILS